jgi:hypothetical protein
MGKIEAVMNDEIRTAPIVCRSSNREAVRTMEDLKRRIVDGCFTITAKVADIRP